MKVLKKLLAKSLVGEVDLLLNRLGVFSRLLVMFWLIYIFAVFGFSYLVGLLFTKRTKKVIIFISMVVLLTPAQIEVNSNDYAPALFTFLFNLILEKDYSLRVLRPIFLSLPTSLLFLWFFIFIKKRFF